MKSKNIFKAAVFTSIISLAMLLFVMISGAAYPDPIFKFFTPISLLIMFLSIGMYFISLCFFLKETITAKQYALAGIVLLFVIIYIIIIVEKISA